MFMDGPKFGLSLPVCNELHFVCRVGIAEKEIVVDVVKNTSTTNQWSDLDCSEGKLSLKIEIICFLYQLRCLGLAQ